MQKRVSALAFGRQQDGGVAVQVGDVTLGPAEGPRGLWKWKDTVGSALALWATSSHKDGLK